MNDISYKSTQREYYIDFRTCLQYFLLYVTYLWNGSSVLLFLRSNSGNLYQLIGLIMIGSGLVITALREKEMIRSRFLQIGIVLLGFTIFVRLVAGGMGLLGYIMSCTPIMATFLAYYVDPEKFPTRMLRTVTVMVAISLFFWLVQLAAPQIIKSIFPAYRNGVTWTDWSVDPPITHDMMDWGKWFFTLVEREPKRNCGIFSEPGNYQVVLNSMLFMVLHLPGFFGLNAKKQIRYAMLFSIAVITTQSTSAYLCLGINLMAYFMTYQEQKGMTTAKRRIMIFGMTGVMILGLEWMINGENSFLYLAIIKKLFSSETDMGVDSSGLARIIKMNACMDMIRQYPLGAGADRVSAAVSALEGGGAGAAIFSYCAEMGIPCVLYTLYWQLHGILSTMRLSLWAKLSFLYLYINTVMAQSTIFWAIFTALGLAVLYEEQKKKTEQKKTCDMLVDIEEKPI